MSICIKAARPTLTNVEGGFSKPITERLDFLRELVRFFKHNICSGILMDGWGQQLLSDSNQVHGRIVFYDQHIHPGLDFLQHTVIDTVFLKYGKGEHSICLLSSTLVA